MTLVAIIIKKKSWNDLDIFVGRDEIANADRVVVEITVEKNGCGTDQK